MRILKFPSYDPAAPEPAVQARAWFILFTAVGIYPAGNKEQSHVGDKVWKALREASESIPNTDDGRRLKSSGTELFLEDAEMRLVAAAVEKLREQIRIANVDALLYVDNLLEKAPEMSKEAYRAGRRKPQLVTATEEA